MTTYNTGNPIGSTAVQDLYDNAENLDIALHTPETTWVDRLGKTRRSWAGSTGYYLLGDYEAGITVTSFSQIIRGPDGEFWRAAAGVTLPYVTTGEGLPESGSFVSIGDAALRQQLSESLDPERGAAMVGYRGRSVQERLDDERNAKDFGAKGDGSADDHAPLSSIAGPWRLSAGIYRVGANLIVNEDVTFAPGAIIKPDSGVTVTFEGAIGAGDYQVFDISEGGAFLMRGRAKSARAAWWGFAPGRTALQNKEAFGAALDACPTSEGAAIYLPAGVFDINTLTVSKSGVSVKGHQAGTWLVNNTVDGPAIEINIQAGLVSYSEISGLRVGQASDVAPGAGNCGVRLKNCDQASLSDVTVISFPAAVSVGFVFDNANNFRLNTLSANGCTSHGYTFSGSSDGNAQDLYAFGCGGHGFRFSGLSGLFASNFHAYSNDSAFFFSNEDTNQFVTAVNWIGDTSNGNNWVIQNLNRSSFANCWAATQKNAVDVPSANGVVITGSGSSDIEFSGLQCLFNNSNGLLITGGASNIRINGGLFGGTQGNGRSGAGSGIRVESATDISVTGARSYGNASSGLLITAANSHYLLVQGNNLRGNTESSLVNSSTGGGHQIVNNIV